ncbi:unnamed protein product [Prorocentrum cordatum]|uniref:Uncharacterized protein n=1 Tax=Prorocentrum cordatum TaxID=2364126 RepID=A0ABN9WJS4_9DINO|nr:unnamed protein product [Polarella glacialis]
MELVVLVLTRHAAALLQPDPLFHCVAHDPIDADQLRLCPTAAEDLSTVVAALLKADPNVLVRTAAFTVSLVLLTAWWNAAHFAGAVAGAIEAPPMLPLSGGLAAALCGHLGELLTEASAVPADSCSFAGLAEPGDPLRPSVISQLFTVIQRASAASAAGGPRGANGEVEGWVSQQLSELESALPRRSCGARTWRGRPLWPPSRSSGAASRRSWRRGSTPRRCGSSSGRWRRRGRSFATTCRTSSRGTLMAPSRPGLPRCTLRLPRATPVPQTARPPSSTRSLRKGPRPASRRRNVTLDPRLLNDNNPWQAVWDEAAGGGRLRRLRCCWRRGGREALLADRQLRRPPAGWGGAVDVTLGGVFTLVAVVIVVVFEALRGLLLGIARLLELGPKAAAPQQAVLRRPALRRARGGAGVPAVGSVAAAVAPVRDRPVRRRGRPGRLLGGGRGRAGLRRGVAVAPPGGVDSWLGATCRVRDAGRRAARPRAGGRAAGGPRRPRGAPDAGPGGRELPRGPLALVRRRRARHRRRRAAVAAREERRAAGGAAAGEGPREGAGAPRAPSAEGAELE